MTQQTPGGPKKPPAKTFDDAFKTMSVSDEERARLEGGEVPPGTPLSDAAEAAGAADPNDRTPAWFLPPVGFAIPDGKEIAFMRFRADWTDKPDLGERQCVLWSLNVGDEKMALDRTMGKSTRTLAELAMQCIRVVDGKRADWTMTLWRKEPDKYLFVPKFWDDIGAKCRQMIINWYSKTHALDRDQLADFFLHCFVVARATSG
jgi:hypothetical protein